MADFWKKVGKVAGIVIGIAGFVAVVVSFLRPGQSAPRSRPGPAGGGNYEPWFVGRGRTKKPGSWSSGRHR